MNHFIKAFIYLVSTVIISFFIFSKTDLQLTKSNIYIEKKIVIQPIGHFDKSLLLQTKSEIQQHFSNIVIMPQIEFSKRTNSKISGKQIADSVIKELGSLAGTNEIYVGITETDICTNKKGNPNYGIIGLGFKPGNANICSTKRIRNRSLFYKIVLHEIGHNYGLNHCSVDSCYMHDAMGKDPTPIITGFCTSCKQYLNDRGWKF